MNSSSLEPLTVHVLSIPRSDRWQAHERLQALSIPSYCSADGHLQVEVNSLAVALQLRSVVQQLTASRAELLNWLEQCWQTD